MRDLIRDYLEKEVTQRTTPGAVVKIKHKGQWVLEEAVGENSAEEDRVPMSVDHLFDVASLTKVMATLPSILILLEEGEFDLNERVSSILPAFGRNGKNDVTIKQLLTHSSGLIAHRPYFQNKLGYDEVLEEIYNDHLVYIPDTKVIYSDLGFILLGEIIKVITNVPLHEFAQHYIFEQAGMANTGYLPKAGRSKLAPTEYLEHLNGHKYGIVHDDNTEFMGGVSGHAGLFSTAGDIARFCDMLENEGYVNGRKILNPAWLKKSRENFTPFSDESRGLGWQLRGEGPSPAGDLTSASTYGHTGFTGTSFYLDPVNSTTVILLTNRVYFGRHERMIRMRPRFHNIVMANLSIS